MTSQELKKLNRMELLDLLLAQTKRADDLEEKLRQAEMKLNERQILLDEAGSIAQAALRVNGVFEAAEAAASQYLESIQTLNARQEEVCSKRESASKEAADKLLSETEMKCQTMESETERRCADMLSTAKRESEAYWDKVRAQLEEYMSSHDALLNLLNIQNVRGMQGDEK